MSHWYLVFRVIRRDGLLYQCVEVDAFFCSCADEAERKTAERNPLKHGESFEANQCRRDADAIHAFGVKKRREDEIRRFEEFMSLPAYEGVYQNAKG